jgi:tryptophanyl-tRNA synthetase
LSGFSLEKIIDEFSGENFSKFKENLSQVVVDKIIPISVEIKKLLSEKKYLEKILSEGSEKADNIASKKIEEIHKIVGF